MPGSPHEILHRVFQEGSTLLASTCRRVLNLSDFDGYEVSAGNIDVTEHVPLEARVDTLLRLSRDGRSQVVIIEAQSARDDRKRVSWPHYIAYMHSKHKCPVTLLVVCHDASVSRWARYPIDIGPREFPCMRVQPFVLGPDNVPAITDLTDATENVEFAVLSALIHSKSEKAREILNVLATALNEIDIPTAERFAELTAAGLAGADASKHWEDLMSAGTYRYESELTRGLRAEGQATTLLEVLRARGIEVSEETEARIRSCVDSDTLTDWAKRAVTVNSADEIFD